MMFLTLAQSLRVMGRDVTGLRVAAVKAKLMGVSNNFAEVSEDKAASANEGVIEVSPNENSNAKHDVLGIKSANLDDSKIDAISSKAEETKSSSPDKFGVGPTSVENGQTKHSVKQSLDLTGDQHGCASPIQEETAVLCRNTSPKINVLPSPSSSKKSQSTSPFISRKRLDDEDNWSTGSSTTASVRAARFKTTVPVAPKFSSSVRLEKRKEFYTKLEEKHKALEAEKQEYEARNKEEEEAAIKQLRKAMMYKANPVPSFYYEGPPPKKELKKVPTTRAVSPKLGRRKSFGDAMHSSAEEKLVCGRAARLSLGSNNKQIWNTPSNSTRKMKNRLTVQNGRSSLTKEQRKQEAKDSSAASVSEKTTVEIHTDISVQS